jgi:hypothetical protein
VRLGRAGSQKLSEIKSEIGSSRHGVVAGFSAEELEMLRHLCLKLAKNMLAPKETEKI